MQHNIPWIIYIIFVRFRWHLQRDMMNPRRLRYGPILNGFQCTDCCSFSLRFASCAQRNDLTHQCWNKMATISQTTCFKTFLCDNVWIPNRISLKNVCPINHIPEFVQIMAWCQPGNKPWSEPRLLYWRIYASPVLSELKRGGNSSESHQGY